MTSQLTRSLSLLSCATLALLSSACGGAAPGAEHPRPTSEKVFEMTAPSVVAILNDDRVDREKEIQELEKSMGDETHAPKHVVDVSLRKEPTPHGTGFAIQAAGDSGGGSGVLIITAAHVVARPDRLKLTTKSGQTVDGELVRIDEVRDVAVIKPKTPLTDVPPLKLADKDPEVGQPVWAMGHTGHGYWKLSWGMSEGIASGIVEMFGSKLLLFDAAVYPGFSGGPVVTIDAEGKPRVAGVNHAILFTGAMLFSPLGPISSAVSVSELRDVAQGHPPPIEAKMAVYAKKQRERQYADVFITDRLSVTRDANDQQVAAIMGDAHSIDIDDDGRVKVPAVAMLFGLGKGSHEVGFEVRDAASDVIASESTTVRVGEHQRVAFASTSMEFKSKTHGKHAVVAKLGDKELGRSYVNLEVSDDDDELSDEHDSDASDDGEPDVDVVVASAGRDNPLGLMGIRAGWAERTYPRRVEYTWFARATRGWSGTDVSITAFVLDEAGHIVGRTDGCFNPEVRPEKAWSCMGVGGMSPPPLAQKEGPYDIVFAINDRPVAWWPMEATIRQDHAPGSDLERWMKDVKRTVAKRHRHDPSSTPTTTTPTTPTTPTTTATPPTPPPGAKPGRAAPDPKPPAPRKPTK
jgi:S1-C subfamily serine protease